MTDLVAQKIFAYLQANNFIPAEVFTLTDDDIADGLTLEDKLADAVQFDEENDYIIVKTARQNLVFFLTSEGKKNYVEDYFKSVDEPATSLLQTLQEYTGYDYDKLYQDWGMNIEPLEDDMSVARYSKTGSKSTTAAGTGLGNYRRGKVLVDIKAIQPGQLLVFESNIFKAVNLSKVTQVFADKFYAIFVKPDNPVEKAKAADEEFVVYQQDLDKGEWFLALEPAPTEVKPEPEPETTDVPAKAPVGDTSGKEPTKGPEDAIDAEDKPVAPAKSDEKGKAPVAAASKKAAKEPRFIFFYKEGAPVEMNGRGLTKAMIDGETESVNNGMEVLLEEMNNEFPLVGGYVSIYVGNATYFTYDILADYSVDTIVSQLKDDVADSSVSDADLQSQVEAELDKLTEWLWANTDVREEGVESASAPAESTVHPEEATASKKVAAELNPRIRSAYETVTEESAAVGDVEDRGWIDEEGESMLPDEFDDDGITVVDKAVAFLEKHYATQTSSSSFDTRLWYMTYPETDYKTGEERTESYFLVDFTPEQLQEVYNRVTGKKASKKVAFGEEPGCAMEAPDSAAEPRRKEDLITGDEQTSFACYQRQAATDDVVEETEEVLPVDEESDYEFVPTEADDLDFLGEPDGDVVIIILGDAECVASYKGKVLARHASLDLLADKVQAWVSKNKFNPGIRLSSKNTQVPAILQRKGDFSYSEKPVAEHLSVGSVDSHAVNLLANIQTLSSATGGEGDDGSAYDVIHEGRNFTGVDETMATAAVEEYLNGKACSFASLEDFAGFVQDMYGITAKKTAARVAEAWHNNDAAAIVSFIKRNAKIDIK